MSYSLPLSAALKRARWKVKIRDKEIREPPHVTLIRGTKAWRIDLRTGNFMDGAPDPREVPAELVDFIRAQTTWRRLCDEWNRMYPSNLIGDDIGAE